MMGQQAPIKENIMTALDNLIYETLAYGLTGTPRRVHSSTCESALKATDDAYVLRRVIPGVRREDVQVSTEGNTLRVTTASKDAPDFASGYANTSWTYGLGNDADVAAADAKHVDGVLTITIPRIKPKRKVYSIAVN